MFTLSFGHCVTSPRRFEPASLAIGAAALALTAMVAITPVRTALSPALEAEPSHPTVTLQASGASLIPLRDAAESLRARLLALPGVGAVQLHGLLTAGLEVDYAPARLARIGVTPDDLRAALSTQTQAPSSGHIAVPLDRVQDGPQPIADRLVQGRGRTFRLGDIATVARIGIDPVSMLSRDGRPAVEVVVVPAPGTAAGSLSRLVAAQVAGMAPAGVTLR